MLKITQITLILLVGISISACSSDKSFTEYMYPERVKYSFDTEDGDSYVYLCKQGDTENETRERAEAAHKQLSANLQKVSEELVNNMMKATDESEGEELGFTDMFKESWDFQKKVEEAALKIETNYQCLMIDSAES